MFAIFNFSMDDVIMIDDEGEEVDSLGEYEDEDIDDDGFLGDEGEGGLFIWTWAPLM